MMPSFKPRESSTTRLDLWLAAVVLLVSVLAIVWASVRHTVPSSSNRARIYRGKQLIETVSLKADRRIDLSRDGMQLEVNAGRVRVIQSDCAKQICVQRGWIRQAGETIICVPNRIRIEMESQRAPKLDAVVS